MNAKGFISAPKHSGMMKHCNRRQMSSHTQERDRPSKGLLHNARMACGLNFG